MNLTLAHVAVPRWWNKRVPTELEFHRLCRRRRIKVIEMPLRVAGFYMVCKGKKFIALNTNLRGVRRLETGFHEIAHDLLHAPVSATTALFCGFNGDRKTEFEARAFAACAVMPEPLLRQLLSLPPDEIGDYTLDMLKFRLTVLDRFGF
jgi:Zn-dependent peptidase ImmA (M78 family)